MTLRRRHLLAASALAPLTGCVTPTRPQPESSPGAPGPTTAPPPTPTDTPTATYPFGLTVPGTVSAVVFDGAFGVDYVEAAADTLRQTYDGLRVRVRSSRDITTDLAGRFDPGSTPPDLIDNSGGDRLTVADLSDELLELDDLMSAINLDGEVIGESLYSGVVEAGTFDGRFVALNYALSVYGLWHSGSLFAAQGWTVPTAWDEMLELAGEARALGQHLFAWADDAADYYAELAITSAIKEGGHEVRRALDNLAPDAWSHPAVMGVLEALAQCVDGGFMLYGGTYLDAQADWSMGRKALFYPSGSWIAKEMDDRTAAGFEMTVATVPTLTAAPTLPLAAVHAQPTEQFLVPKNAANPAGGLELLRVMLSRPVAEEFARTNLVPTVVRASVPADLESTALTAQTRMLGEAGENVFSWRFISYYGLSEDYRRLWGDFLRGDLGPTALAEQLQSLADAVRDDADVPKYTAD